VGVVEEAWFTGEESEWGTLPFFCGGCCGFPCGSLESTEKDGSSVLSDAEAAENDVNGGRASWVGEVVVTGEVGAKRGGPVRGGRATRREGKAKGGERSPEIPPAIMEGEGVVVGELMGDCMPDEME